MLPWVNIWDNIPNSISFGSVVLALNTVPFNRHTHAQTTLLVQQRAASSASAAAMQPNNLINIFRLWASTQAYSAAATWQRCLRLPADHAGEAGHFTEQCGNQWTLAWARSTHHHCQLTLQRTQLSANCTNNNSQQTTVDISPKDTTFQQAALPLLPEPGWDKGGNVTSTGWQVTLWHLSSRSGVATLRTAIHLLLTYLLTVSWAYRQHGNTSCLIMRHLSCLPPRHWTEQRSLAQTNEAAWPHHVHLQPDSWWKQHRSLHTNNKDNFHTHTPA